MAKLSKLASNGTPMGTFAPLWEVFRVSSDKLALCHLELTRKLQDLIKDVLRYGEEQLKAHKRVRARGRGQRIRVPGLLRPPDLGVPPDARHLHTPDPPGLDELPLRAQQQQGAGAGLSGDPGQNWSRTYRLWPASAREASAQLGADAVLCRVETVTCRLQYHTASPFLCIVSLAAFVLQGESRSGTSPAH
uniref:Uncharacterized LOC107134834 n=2 Tax=Marmota marmota marmota TaxID=9994 RepID=A0A8C6ESC8_MARMA